MKSSQPLCPLPFVHPFFDVRGYYSACCNGSFNANSKHISQMSAVEWFYSEDMQQLRDDMLEGRRNSMCDHCWKKDDLGITSPRITHIDHWKKFNIDYDNPKPKYFDLKPSNHCNLACVFCTGNSSDKIIKISEKLDSNAIPSRWKSSLEKQKKLESIGTFDKTVIDYIKNNIQDLEVLKFTGGEPFLSKEVLDILKMVSELKPQVEIKITTNGTVITKDFHPILQKMHKTSIKFSIDAVDDLYSYIRFPSKWDQFNRRIKNSMNNLPNVKFNVNCLLTNLNLEQLPKIRNWFKKLQQTCSNLEYLILDPNLTPIDTETSLYCVDPEVLKSIKIFLSEQTKNWDINDKSCDKQILNVFKKIDDAIEKNIYYKMKHIIAKEFQLQNQIRGSNVVDLVEPITKQFLEKLI